MPVLVTPISPLARDIFARIHAEGPRTYNQMRVKAIAKPDVLSAVRELEDAGLVENSGHGWDLTEDARKVPSIEVPEAEVTPDPIAQMLRVGLLFGELFAMA